MLFLMGIADLVQNRRKRFIPPVTKIDAERIEGVSEHSGIAEKADGHARRIYPGVSQVSFNPGAERFTGRRAVIPVVERQRRPAVIAEQPKTAVEIRQFVEIQQQGKHRVPQAMPSRAHPLVHHRSFVNRTPEHQAAISC